jgi:hypothetical protein
MLNEAEALSNAPNSPELDTKILGLISADFAKVCDNLREASYQIRSRGFSEWPIFALSKSILPIGSLFLAQMEMADNQYNYYASMYEEFAQRQLIAADAEEVFKANYKEPNEYCCLFVMDQSFSGFVFLPFPED